MQRSQSAAGFCAILDKGPCVDGKNIITATPRTGRGRYGRVHEKAGTRHGGGVAIRSVGQDGKWVRATRKCQSAVAKGRLD